MLTIAVKSVVGPRIPAAEFARAYIRYLFPLVFFLLAGVILLVSTDMPYWRLTLHAPQYPKGLTVRAYLTHLTGDTQEINELNHYIGMMPLELGGQIERSTAVAALIGVALLLLLASLIHTRWAALLALPALLFPLVFLIDLQGWLYYCGHHLDKKAALSSSIKPFTPHVLGLGRVGQFKTVAMTEQGFWLAVAAAVIVLVGLWFHRRAYKPLADSRHKLVKSEARA
jgi:hypothetical protein